MVSAERNHILVSSYCCLLKMVVCRSSPPDISPAAIERARGRFELRRFQGSKHYGLRSSAEGRWDLIVINETIYYLGWLYSFFDVVWLAAELFAATRNHGRLLMANTRGGVEDYLLRSWIIRTYHDLFVNVGYRLESEQDFRGTKDRSALEVFISLFLKVREKQGPPVAPIVGG